MNRRGVYLCVGPVVSGQEEAFMGNLGVAGDHLSLDSDLTYNGFGTTFFTRQCARWFDNGE
jgi:hypothetical protein